MCKIDGCERSSQYKSQDVCQMHYFRFMRGGSYELKKRKEKFFDDRGYVLMCLPNHKLSSKNGLIREHTVVAYAKYGDTLPDCELCGKRLLWGGRSTHIDHIDNDKSNNAPENLRPLCNGCNSSRPYREGGKLREGALYISFNGRVMSVKMWAKEPGVMVSSGTIRNRKNSGMSDYDCLFKEKATHKQDTQKRA